MEHGVYTRTRCIYPIGVNYPNLIFLTDVRPRTSSTDRETRNCCALSVLVDMLYRVPLYFSIPFGDRDALFSNYFPPPPLFPPPPPAWNSDTNAILREAIFISIDSQKPVSSFSEICRKVTILSSHNITILSPIYHSFGKELPYIYVRISSFDERYYGAIWDAIVAT